MRKGTKSCLECRRRKIKCTFEAGRPQVCNECFARGSTCIDQEHGDVHSYAPQPGADQSTYSLRERVSQLESLVRQVLHKLPDKEDSHSAGVQVESRSVIDTQAAEVLKSLKSSQPVEDSEESLQLPRGLRDDAPALTLFDNAVISRHDKAPELSRARYNKSKALVAALNKLLPSPRDLDIMLEASSKWFDIWRQMFPEIADLRCGSVKESVSHSLRSDNPAEIAKTMLCIAISVHQMPPDFDWQRLQLRDDPRDLMDKYIAAIDELITGDDEIAATVPGIECMILEAKYHINMGRPRRSWLLFRRAIAFAQLLGLHRLSTRKPPDDDEGGEYHRQVSLWSHLFVGDRCISLILGLPYMVSQTFCDPYIPPYGVDVPGVAEAQLYALRLCSIVTKVVDRNQSPVPIPYSATVRIDQELEEMKEKTDPSWWTYSRIPGSSIQEHFDRLQAQFIHHQIRAILHMPFMLKSSFDKRYQYSHQAALESSREMIKCYKSLRTNTDIGPYICKCIDFQAFTAAMLLVLNLCGYNQHVRGLVPQQPDLEQDQLDSALIDESISILHEASKESGGIVAAQSVKALEMLASARHCSTPEQVEKCGQHRQRVSIPYFGTITLGIGKHFVPIKPGTYPESGKQPPARANGVAHAVTLPGTGLPTPPSLCSGSSQPSPMSTALDASAKCRTDGAKDFYGAETEFIAPGLENQSYATIGSDDPFVTFDSYMTFPPPGDFPLTTTSSESNIDSASISGRGSSGSGGGSWYTSHTPQTFQSSMGGSGNGESNLGASGSDPSSGGFPWGLPFATTGGASDLDHTWTWSGDLQW